MRVEEIADKLKVRIEYRSFPGELDGMLISQGKDKVIGVNSEHSKERQRFTIAHELGHLLLHPSEKVHIDPTAFKVYFRGPRSTTGLDAKEIEANRFAAELLMPLDFLRADLRDKKIDALDEDGLVAELAEEYEVSRQAMTIRLTNLGLGDGLGVEP